MRARTKAIDARAVLIAAVAAVLLAGCGGDADVDAATTLRLPPARPAPKPLVGVPPGTAVQVQLNEVGCVIAEDPAPMELAPLGLGKIGSDPCEGRTLEGATVSFIDGASRSRSAPRSSNAAHAPSVRIERTNQAAGEFTRGFRLLRFDDTSITVSVSVNPNCPGVPRWEFAQAGSVVRIRLNDGDPTPSEERGCSAVYSPDQLITKSFPAKATSVDQVVLEYAALPEPYRQACAEMERALAGPTLDPAALVEVEDLLREAGLYLGPLINPFTSVVAGDDRAAAARAIERLRATVDTLGLPRSRCDELEAAAS